MRCKILATMFVTAQSRRADWRRFLVANAWRANQTAPLFVLSSPAYVGSSFPSLRMWESGPGPQGGVFFCWASDRDHFCRYLLPTACAVVDLCLDRALVEETWRNSQADCTPLAVAAAFTFHQTRRTGETLLSPQEYANALDIAAAALSCLLPIHTPDGLGAQVPVSIDLARQRFCGGATRVQCVDGTVLAPLAVIRSDVLPALIAIERSMIEYLAPRGPPSPRDPAQLRFW
jgi:hypothetical protein